ncbi:hypothetical protein [Rhodococcus marinonascens]|uniref:hypothetical protein n=1 Tax=Rhodococcus marinonascens TaxID=38311 RepID=UPI00093354EC|nr:hypothetical protein [Rhodococcus marinonascens]
MLGLATAELASATGDTTVRVVDAGVAAAEADAHKIAAARQARAEHERIRHDPNATDDQIQQAYRARVAAETDAPENEPGVRSRPPPPTTVPTRAAATAPTTPTNE